MKSHMKAIEVTGTVDQEGKLHLDEALDAIGPGKVRVILLMMEKADLDENEWLRSAANNPAFEFLSDSEEDNYSLADGKPFNDQG